MILTKKNIFFSLVIYKQKINEIEKLLFSIQALEKHIQNEFNVFFLISDNSPRKYIEKPLLKHEAILRKTSYTFHNFNLGYGRGHNFNLLKGETKFIKKNPKDIFLIVNPDIESMIISMNSFVIQLYGPVLIIYVQNHYECFK